MDGAPVASMTPETFKAALQQRPLRLRPASSTGTVTHRYRARIRFVEGALDGRKPHGLAAWFWGKSGEMEMLEMWMERCGQ